ncbi:MAG TPA: hypothetical protein PLY86_14460, partial [bacterium]|nr:hypothetical protein [bacterium]
MFWKRKKQEPEPSIEPLRNDEASQDLPSDDESQIAQTVTPTEAETPIESPPVESLSEPETPKKRGLFGKLFDRLRASRDA